MDGFDPQENIVIFGATNLRDSLDPALLRPGRFDRSIDVILPDIEAREKIFKVHLAKIKLSEEKTLENFARRLSTLTPGFSGADIANICNEVSSLFDYFTTTNYWYHFINSIIGSHSSS